MKNYLLVILSLMLFACGISPEDAADELDWSIAHPEEWCGWKPNPPIPEEEKVLNHPDGYGISATYGCFDSDATWPGGFCWAPATKTHKWRIFDDGQPNWAIEASNEFGVVRDFLNSHSWNITKVNNNTFTIADHTGTTNPDGSGTLGASFQNGWVNHGNITGQGDYWTFSTCEAWLFKASIAANVFYQSASDTEKEKYRKNLRQHEQEHCVGLAHLVINNLLMSSVYNYPGPMFSNNLNITSGQMDMLANFNPI